MNVPADDPLSAWCETVIRFIAAQMLDPHRYFEQKLLGQLGQARDDGARLQLSQRLVGWLARDQLLTAAQRTALDSVLEARGWPSTTLAERDPARAGRMLIEAKGDSA